MKNYILITGLFLGLSISGYSQSGSVNLEHSKWANFKTNEGSLWKISRNTPVGVPNVLYNGLTKAYSGEPESMARQFLTEYRELFSMKKGLTDLEFVRTRTNRGVYHVTFNQKYKGLLVLDGQYKVHIRENGQVHMANGNYYPGIDISVNPFLTGENAQTLAHSMLNSETSQTVSFSTPELIIYPYKDSDPVLAYKLKEKSTYTEFIIDATSGKILEQYKGVTTAINTGINSSSEVLEGAGEKTSNSADFYKRRRATSEGNIFSKHPGYSIYENTGVDLLRLNSPGDELTGTYVEVLNTAGAEADPTDGSAGNYDFFYYANLDEEELDPDPEFDEVNLYYHIDKFRADFIENIDNGGLQLGQIVAHAHSNSTCTGGANNACFDPSTGDIHFGDGDGGTDFFPFAWEDKVIYHEYMHAITYDIQSEITSQNNEEGAINEGVSDYMAGSFASYNHTSNRPKIFEYAAPAEDRNMSNPFIGCYSSGCAEPYTDHIPVAAHNGGEFFSSILWDIRNAGGGITAAETDILVYDALYYLDSNPNFEEFLIAMLTADAVAYSGDHADIIIDKFDLKGIDISSNESGHITSNTTWDGVRDITGTVYVDDTYILTIDPGTVVRIDDGQSLIVSPGGKLIVNGTELSPVVFERLDPANDWNEISLESSSGNTISWALFDGGYINLSIESKNNTIEHSTFLNATHRAIQGWTNQDGSGNAEATISHSLIDGSPSSGIVANYLDLNLNNTTIKNSDDDGLYINSATVYPFYQNLITDNGYVNSRDGVQVTSSGTFYMLGASYVEGYNEISDNSEDQIYNSGDTIVGAALGGDGGYNSIKGSYLGSTYLVNTSSSVNATGTWWGQSSTSSSMFNGTVSGSHLTSDPTTTPGNDGESPGKVVQKEPIDFEFLFDEAEQQLVIAENLNELNDRFHKLYQVEGLANNPEISNRFQSMALNAAQGLAINYSSQSLNAAFEQQAKVFYMKSLIRNEQYSEAKTYLDQTDLSEMSEEYQEDYLHLKMITEAYHGLYQQAQATLDGLYLIQQANGEDIEELKARYLPIEDDLLARSNTGEGIVNPDRFTQSDANNNDEYSLQNHPNPFNPVTNISYSLPDRSFISLKVYDLLGREVAVLVNEIKYPGEYTARLDASKLSSGVYVYQLKIGNRVFSKKMTLIK